MEKYLHWILCLLGHTCLFYLSKHIDNATMHTLLFPGSLLWSHTFLLLWGIQYQLQKRFHTSLTCLASFAWINYLSLSVLWPISLKGHLPNQPPKTIFPGSRKKKRLGLTLLAWEYTACKTRVIRKKIIVQSFAWIVKRKICRERFKCYFSWDAPHLSRQMSYLLQRHFSTVRTVLFAFPSDWHVFNRAATCMKMTYSSFKEKHPSRWKVSEQLSCKIGF